MSKPLLSIVVANYNYGSYLEEAVKSVANQTDVDKVELIICDAASTDNSVDIIKKYANGLPPNTSYSKWISSASPSLHHSVTRPLITWWCSEKDGGQSAAFNKGFSHARGKWLTWLNADDLLLPGTIAAFSALVSRHRGAKWVTGNKLAFDSSTRRIIDVNWGPHIQPPLLKGRKAFREVYGPTTFWRRALYYEIGPIDEHLHFAMDSEYWARLTMAGIRQTRLNHICWGFRIHPLSKTEGEQSQEVKDRRQREMAYWIEKTQYIFPQRLSNPYYLLWIMWRIVDGSWIARIFFKYFLINRHIDVLYK